MLLNATLSFNPPIYPERLKFELSFDIALLDHQFFQKLPPMFPMQPISLEGGGIATQPISPEPPPITSPFISPESTNSRSDDVITLSPKPSEANIRDKLGAVFEMEVREG